jgi:HEAT repeat protein
MDKTLQNLLALAREGNVERRSAALLVLGALKLDDDAVLEAVGAALENGNIILKDYALRYCEEVRPKACIPRLLPLLQDNEKGTVERAVRLLSNFGQPVVRPLLQQAKGANRAWHLQAAQVLCAVRGKAAWQGLLQLLVLDDIEVNRTICDLVATAVRDLDEKEQDVLYGEVDTFATALGPQQHRAATISAIRLLGTLGRPQARKWLIGFIGSDQHHSVRFHALVALLHCLRGQDLHKAELARLLPLLEEKEFSDAVRLTLDLLDAHDLPEEYQPALARLLESPHVAVQKFALRKMGEFDSPAVVRTLVQQLDDPDTTRRDAAARSLRKIPAARTALTKEFLAGEDPSKAWVIAEILPIYEGKWRRDTLDEIWGRLETALEAEERISGAYLHFLKQVDPEYAYAQFAARGDKLKKAKKYKEAIRFLSPLKEFPDWAADDKFALAVAQLKLHSHDVVSAPSRHDPALDLLSDLYRSSAFPVFEALKKEKGLEPEDLFYVGFRFAEGAPEVRSLGEDVLEFLAEKYPRTKVGKSAKNKLKLLNQSA